jgi:hypothetical protein
MLVQRSPSLAVAQRVPASGSASAISRSPNLMAKPVGNSNPMMPQHPMW